MRRETAKALAIRHGQLLKQYCEVLHITGEVRRQVFNCNSIDLICVPRFTILNTVDLFGAQAGGKVISENFIGALESLGVKVKGKWDDRQVQIKLRENIVLNVYMPLPEEFFRRLAITTGSDDYVRRNMFQQELKMGWVDTEQGLRRADDCIVSPTTVRNYKYPISNHEGERPPVWDSEEHYFNWLKIPLIATRLRTI
jgi:hypothetical protein